MTRLVQALRKQIEGRDGLYRKRKIALAINRGERMVDRYAKEQSEPDREMALKIGLALDLSEREALDIASEYPLVGQRRTA